MKEQRLEGDIKKEQERQCAPRMCIIYQPISDSPLILGLLHKLRIILLFTLKVNVTTKRIRGNAASCADDAVKLRKKKQKKKEEKKKQKKPNPLEEGVFVYLSDCFTLTNVPLRSRQEEIELCATC